MTDITRSLIEMLEQLEECRFPHNPQTFFRREEVIAIIRQYQSAKPGTVTTGNLKAEGGAIPDHLQDPWGNLIKIQGEPVPLKPSEIPVASPLPEALDILDRVRKRCFIGSPYAELRDALDKVYWAFKSCFPTRESDNQSSSLYKALWSLRHALQVDLYTTQGQALLLFHNDDYSLFEHAKINWQRESLRFLKSCLDQADAALSEIEAVTT
jgi:hypothetical protein